MWALRVTANGRTERYTLREGETLVGRGAGCDIVVVDESMSRRHARIVVTAVAARVEDLDSRNGVFRNGTQIKDAELVPGDVLRFGTIEALVETPAPSPSASTPALTLEHTIYRRMELVTNPAEQTVVVDARRVLRLMSEVGKTLVASRPLPDVLARVVELLLAHIPAERAVILLIDPATGSLVPTVSRLRDGTTGLLNTTVSKTVTDLVLSERASILSADVLGDNRFDTANSLRLQNVRSLMCGPLSTQNENIGVLSADNALAERFSEADLELFTALANYASTAISQSRLAERVQEEMQRRQRLARYHSPAVVDAVLSGSLGEDDTTVVQERDVSVLFVDVVGFTAIAESMTPKDVAELLNGFFTAVTDVIFDHQGTVDKFIGDAVLAVFGAPLHQEDHPWRAVNAARGILVAVQKLNQSRPEMPPLRIRVAVNSGSAIVGDVGSGKRIEYTVLGDVVNTASRMESSVAKPNQVVMSRATLDRLPVKIPTTSLGALQLRGRTGSVEVFSVDPEP